MRTSTCMGCRHHRWSHDQLCHGVGPSRNVLMALHVRAVESRTLGTDYCFQSDAG